MCVVYARCFDSDVTSTQCTSTSTEFQVRVQVLVLPSKVYSNSR